MASWQTIFVASSSLGLTGYGLALLFIKASLVLLVAQIVAEQFELSSASFRHTIWLSAFLSLALLPLLTRLLPIWPLIPVELPASAWAAVREPNSFPGQGVGERGLFASLSLFDLLVAIYLSVVVMRLYTFARSLAAIRGITARAVPLAISVDGMAGWRRVSLKYSSEVTGPVTWGTLFPVILLPWGARHWSGDEWQMVLRHEIGHIRRFDWLSQLLGLLVATLYWPVPGMRRALSLLTLEAERACDNLVLNGDPLLSHGGGVWIEPAPNDPIKPADYAALLLRQAQLNHLPATVALGSGAELVLRVRHIVSSYIDRNAERRGRWLLVLAALLLLLPFAAIKVVGRLPVDNPLAAYTVFPVTSMSNAIAPQPPSSQFSSSFGTALGSAINAPTKPVSLKGPGHLNGEDLLSHGLLNLAFNTDGAHDLPGATLAQTTDSPVFDRPVIDGPAANNHDDYSLLPEVLYQLSPRYPDRALRRGVEGDVLVEFDLDPSGWVVHPRVIRAEPTRLFDEAVISALSQYRYRLPASASAPIAVTGLRKLFQFRLENSGNRPTESRVNVDGASAADSKPPPADSG